MSTIKTTFRFPFVLLLMLLIAQNAKPQNADLHIKVTNIREHVGFVRVALWNNGKGFPKEKEFLYKKTFHKADADTLDFLFMNIPFGEYAISLFHDKNANKEFDKNRLARTSEPFGLSGKPNFHERPPKFEDCKLKIEKHETEIIIRLMDIEEVQQIIKAEQ